MSYFSPSGLLSHKRQKHKSTYARTDTSAAVEVTVPVSAHAPLDVVTTDASSCYYPVESKQR